MPLDAPREAGRLDPRRALAQDPLAAPLLDAAGPQPALQHLRAHDPRARLEHAARALHGRAAELPREDAAEPEPERPRRRAP